MRAGHKGYVEYIHRTRSPGLKRRPRDGVDAAAVCIVGGDGRTMGAAQAIGVALTDQRGTFGRGECGAGADRKGRVVLGGEGGSA